jgi:hypothetical protein
MARLEEVADRLYEIPPEEFVAARTEEAERARAAGDRELAAAITKLRKPTLGAWVVNLLAHRRPDLVRELLALATALRKAQRELRGEDLRELSQRRRQTVSALARDALGLAVASGRRREALPAAEVESTLMAALADPEVAETVRAGQLTKTTSYAGFGEIPRPQLRLVQGGEVVPAAEPASRPAKQPASEQPASKRPAGQPTEQPSAAQQRAEERRAAAERAAAERAAAREAAAARRKQEAAAHRELLAARTALAEAEAARAAAERAVTSARRRVEAATAAIEALRSAG